MGTNMGDIRLYDSGRDALDIVALSGFPADFIEHYQSVSCEEAATCARAIKSRNRVVIDDIEIEALSEPQLRMAAAGGYRAMQSTPLLSRGGNLLGVLSTYCRNPSKLTERDFKILNLYGRFTADLIERLQVEKTLRESEERLRLATQSGKVGVWDWDLVANRMSWTESLYVIYGVGPAHFHPTVESVVSMIHPSDRERVAGLIENTLRSETACEIVFRAVQPSGNIIWLFTNATALFDKGRPVRMLGVTVVISERKRAEEALHESEERFRDMADHAPMMVWSPNLTALAVSLVSPGTNLPVKNPIAGLAMIGLTHSIPMISPMPIRRLSLPIVSRNHFVWSTVYVAPMGNTGG